MNNPRVFISYSWGDPEVTLWVREFKEELRSCGVDAYIDKDLLQPGDNWPTLIEKAIRESDFILAICTPEYKEKADNADENPSGVAAEFKQIYNMLAATGKERRCIPVLRKGRWADSMPSALKGKVFIDLTDGSQYASDYRELLETLHGLRASPRPLGPVRILPWSIKTKVIPNNVTNTLVLLYALPGETAKGIPGFVADLRRVHHDLEVLVCADERFADAEIAIACLEARAFDFFVIGTDDAVLHEQIRKAKEKLSPYVPYPYRISKGKVLVITESNPEALHVYKHGILPVLNRLSLQPICSDPNEMTSLSVIEEHLKDRVLLIANISQYNGKNPEIALVLDCAARQKIPVILAHRAEHGYEPTAGAAAEIVKYYSCVDLAMRLFIGLRECIR